MTSLSVIGPPYSRTFLMPEPGLNCYSLSTISRVPGGNARS